MTVQQLVEALNLKVMVGEESLNREITGGYTSDLLSDVMGNLSEGALWITLQTHRNVMAVASLKDAAAVLLVKDLTPDPDLLKFAIEEEIPILSSGDDAFEISGKIYQLLNS